VALALWVLVYAAAILAGDLFVRLMCRKLRLPKEGQEGLGGAGRFIGYFERFIVLSLLMVGQYQAIAFIFAGKSIARFSRQEQVEYYLVGTFASLSWALAWGWVLKWALAVI